MVLLLGRRGRRPRQMALICTIAVDRRLMLLWWLGSKLCVRRWTLVLRAMVRRVNALVVLPSMVHSAIESFMQPILTKVCCQLRCSALTIYLFVTVE